jgi:hypothetical protein
LVDPESYISYLERRDVFKYLDERAKQLSSCDSNVPFDADLNILLLRFRERADAAEHITELNTVDERAAAAVFMYIPLLQLPKHQETPLRTRKDTSLLRQADGTPWGIMNCSSRLQAMREEVEKVARETHLKRMKLFDQQIEKERKDCIVQSKDLFSKKLMCCAIFLEQLGFPISTISKKASLPDLRKFAEINALTLFPTTAFTADLSDVSEIVAAIERKYSSIQGGTVEWNSIKKRVSGQFFKKSIGNPFISLGPVTRPPTYDEVPSMPPDLLANIQAHATSTTTTGWGKKYFESALPDEDEDDRDDD